MSKKFSFSDSEHAKAEHHLGLHKGFSGLVSNFSRATAMVEADQPELAGHYSAIADHCKTMAECHKALAAEHTKCGEAAEKAVQDQLGKTLRHDGARGIYPDAPEEQRVRMINRVGGAPDQRRDRPKVEIGDDGQPDVSKVDPMLTDLVKAST